MEHETFSSEKKPSITVPDATMPTPDRQANPLLSATELFVGVDRHDSSEINIFQELSNNLLGSAPERDRRRVAALLVRHPQAPQIILEKLARDPDPLTAYPVLRHTEALSEDILLEAAENGPDSARKALALRDQVSESVKRKLLLHAGSDIIRSLLDRDDVTLDSASMAALENRHEILADLGTELAARGLLTADQKMARFLYLDRPLREEAISAAELANLVEMTRQGGGRGLKPVFKAELLEILKASAIRGTNQQFATELGFTLGLPEDVVGRMLREDSGEALAIALKALGFSKSNTTSMLVRLLGSRLTIDDIRRLISISATISAGAARLLVQSWIASETLGLSAAGAGSRSTYQDSVRRKEMPASPFEKDAREDRIVVPASVRSA